MALRHAIFVKCSEHCDDPHMVDIFFGLAYGLMPFCVTEDTNQGTLYFRRSFGPTEKDKVCPFVFVRLFFLSRFTGAAHRGGQRGVVGASGRAMVQRRRGIADVDGSFANHGPPTARCLVHRTEG